MPAPAPYVAPPVLVDVTPLTLSVETVGGYSDPLIARNTPVPCSKTREFVTAAHVVGASTTYLIVRTLLPNLIGPLMVLVSLGFAYAVLYEASLSFLGLGAQAPTPEWGAMLSTARDFLFQLDGSCGFQWETGRLSFQPIEYPEWDISFCHAIDFDFPLIDALAERFDLHLETDSTVYMHDTPQVWCATRLYDAERSDLWRPSTARAALADPVAG